MIKLTFQVNGVKAMETIELIHFIQSRLIYHVDIGELVELIVEDTEQACEHAFGTTKQPPAGSSER